MNIQMVRPYCLFFFCCSAVFSLLFIFLAFSDLDGHDDRGSNAEPNYDTGYHQDRGYYKRQEYKHYNKPNNRLLVHTSLYFRGMPNSCLQFTQ